MDGWVFWITGLSGAGKTTVAGRVVQHLRAEGRTVVSLDGDVLRQVLDAESDHAPDARRRLALTYARLCRMLAGQGLDVVCATISMFDEVRAFNRAAHPRYLEIYLRAPVDELKRRDPKGLYAQAAASPASGSAAGPMAGPMAGMVGAGQAAELPTTPDLLIDNHGAVSPDDAADKILALFRSRLANDLKGDQL